MKKTLQTIGLVILTVVLSVLVQHFFGGEKIAYFDYNKVYNDSPVKISLEKELGKVVGMRKSQLDSLRFELNVLGQKIDSKTVSAEERVKFEMLKEEFATRQQSYEEENMRLKQSYGEQIRKEINQKAAVFAKNNGLDFLLAAMGDGSIMYGSEKYDMTEKFQEFIGK